MKTSLLVVIALFSLVATSVGCGGASGTGLGTAQGAATDSDFTQRLKHDEAATAALDAQFFVSDVGYDSVTQQPAIQPSDVIPGSDLDTAYKNAAPGADVVYLNRVTANGFELIVMSGQSDNDLNVSVFHPQTQQAIAHKLDYYSAGLWTYDVQVEALKATTLDATQFTATQVPGTPDAVVQAFKYNFGASTPSFSLATVASEQVYLAAAGSAGNLSVWAFRPDGAVVDYGSQASGQSTVAWR
jgi:hypothetical protein